MPINKHGFVIFYLKIEEIKLGNVPGKRANHNSGLWIPPNPWDSSKDTATATLNVSQDDLLRARVKGWFMGDNSSIREKSWIDTNGNGVKDPGDQLLPEGRWVLPDDWEYLAGPNWKTLRPHWDIMDRPNDNIISVCDADGDKAEKFGDYINGPLGNCTLITKLVAVKPVIGPYNQLDHYDPLLQAGVWADPKVPGGLRKTVVPNGELDRWDAPMPPAKMMFTITKGPGFFKAADKADIYYLTTGAFIYYTSPFYAIEVPASPFIPPYVNNGGYDWDSWGGWAGGAAQGPYNFWHIFNYLTGDVPAEDSMHPTKVEVYSDNHGEAMVYLNGDANLKLTKDFFAPTGTVVGTTVVKATADYPYLRKHPSVDSNTVTKTWTWGKEIAIRVRQWDADPLRKIIYAFVTDRDGFPVYGEQVDFAFDSAAGLIDKVLKPTGWETVGGRVQEISVFTQKPDPKQIDVYLKPVKDDPSTPLNEGPTSGVLGLTGILDEAAYYNPIRHGVAGIVVFRSEPSGVDIRVAFHEREGIIVKDVYLNFAYISPVDPIVPLAAGKWNQTLFISPTTPIAVALSSIPKDVEVTVWSSKGKAYKSSAPAWANDLKQMEWGVTYYFWVSKPATWIYGE
jgi:hypothetical protein